MAEKNYWCHIRLQVEPLAASLALEYSVERE